MSRLTGIDIAGPRLNTSITNTLTALTVGDGVDASGLHPAAASPAGPPPTASSGALAAGAMPGSD